jgi:hypothetical protein
MACNAQTILDDSACLYAMPSFWLAVVQTGTWCSVNGLIGPVADARFTSEGDARVTSEGDTRTVTI